MLRTHRSQKMIFKAIVEQYKMEVEAGVKFIREYYAMAPRILYRFKKG